MSSFVLGCSFFQCVVSKERGKICMLFVHVLCQKGCEWPWILFGSMNLVLESMKLVWNSWGWLLTGFLVHKYSRNYNLSIYLNPSLNTHSPHRSYQWKSPLESFHLKHLIMLPLATLLGLVYFTPWQSLGQVPYLSYWRAVEGFNWHFLFWISLSR